MARTINRSAHRRGALRTAARLASPNTILGLAREARGLATHLLLYPIGLSEPRVEPTEDPHDAAWYDTPVVLVHGYFHNRSGFFFLSRALRRAGFRWVHGMNYNPIGESIQTLAARLARHVDDVRRASGSDRVHVVGHSLGGVIARYYIQELGGADRVDHCVTIGTPHHGTYAAFAGVGRAARQIRPGSPLLQRLNESLRECPTRFVNLYSDLDVLIVPPESAILPYGPTVENHLIHDFGHTSLLISSELTDVVTGHLVEAEIVTKLADVRRLPTRRERVQRAAGR